jgi:hypothetical protein
MMVVVLAPRKRQSPYWRILRGRFDDKASAGIRPATLAGRE